MLPQSAKMAHGDHRGKTHLPKHVKKSGLKSMTLLPSHCDISRSSAQLMQPHSGRRKQAKIPFVFDEYI
uniref:Uncharacterized protein n=1 Tax=Anguilla anguilla TaxID=7936 RepID=A0A0E9U8T1_ANGAN